MRLTRYDVGNTGIIIGEGDSPGVLDVATSIETFSKKDRVAASLLSPFFKDTYCDWTRLIASWDVVQEPLTALQRFAEEESHPDVNILPQSSLRLRPPLPSPHIRIFAIGANFADHGAGAHTKRKGRVVTEEHFHEEKASGLPPWGFLVIPDLVIGDGSIATPPEGTQLFDYEIEIAIVLRQAKASGEYKVWGAGIWNDLSLRDPHFGHGEAVDRGPLTWSLQKNFDSGNVFGPWLTIEEDLDVSDLDMRLWVNEDLRQDGNSSAMLYRFEECIQHLERYLSLRPGDIITSGTPAGTALDRPDDGYLRPGDVIRAEVEGLGKLTTPIGTWEGAPSR